MKNLNDINFLKAAELLKKSDFDYEYCHPDRVRESDMNSYISEIETDISEMEINKLAELIKANVSSSDVEIMNEIIENETEEINLERIILECSASNICHAIVKNFCYETVSFQIYLPK